MTNPDNNLPDEIAPVFLELGKAAYICQCFESSLCFLLSQMEHEKSRPEEGAFQAAWDFHSSKPLGALLRSLRKQIEVPEDLDDYLNAGVKIRNKIVHGYLTNNIKRLYDPKGRLEIEKELEQLKNEVKRRDTIVNQLIDTLLKKYRLSAELLKRNADRLWDHLNPKNLGDSSGTH